MNAPTKDMPEFYYHPLCRASDSEAGLKRGSGSVCTCGAGC